MKLSLLSFTVISCLLLFSACTPLEDSQNNTPIETSETGPVPENTSSEESSDTDVSREERLAYSLDLGDGKYSDSAQKGYIFSCDTDFHGGGAFQDGPWIEGNVWYPSKKDVSVSGSVLWGNAEFDLHLDGNERIIETNNLPLQHATGIYPIAQSDDAYEYDRNPNSIVEQDISVSLPRNPSLSDAPSCLDRGPIGIMLSGVPIYNALDEGGRDAVAHEIQDSCQGHPQQQGQYHYHSESNCLEDAPAEGEHSALMGYALDGFGIYGKHGEEGTELHTQDLDICHGHTHEIAWDGEIKEMYHYHFTEDYPYSLGCFMGIVPSA